MKRGIIIFLFLLLISLAIAKPTLNFQNEEIQPGETIIATITTPGSFERQIESHQIKFYEGRKQVSFEYDIKFYEGTHYLYIYTTREDSFRIEISEILYKEDTLGATKIIKEFNVTKNIEVDTKTNETTTQILQIKPGFIFTTQIPEIKLTNKGTKPLEIEYNEEKITIEPLKTKEIQIKPEKVFSYLNISTYKEFSIPIIYLSANSTFVSPSVKSDLRQNPEILEAELFTENKTEKIIELFNFGNDTLTKIEINSNLDFIKFEKLEDIGPRGTKNLTLEFNAKYPGSFEGNINITYTQEENRNTLLIPIKLFILPKGSNESDFKPAEETCEQLLGTVCNSNETCFGNASFTKSREYCCLGTCEPIKPSVTEGSGFGWLIGIVIIAILGFGGYYLYKKQKEVGPKKPEEQLKESSEKYNQRLMGDAKFKRISGGLTKS